MDIDTNWAVKQFFPNPSFVQIYHEAVANAFDANASNIDISITTSAGKRNTTTRKKNIQISIKDDGDGFTDSSFEQFRRIIKPKDEYHKGLGRLVYLHYFAQVFVKSIYGDNKEYKRTFSFDPSWQGNSEVETAQPSDAKGTELRFMGFINRKIRDNSEINPESLKLKILEQFLPFLYKRKVNGKDFRISIRLQSNNEDLVPNQQEVTFADIPDLESLIIPGNSLGMMENITMYYRIHPEPRRKNVPLVAACIDERTIPIKLLNPGAIPADQQTIFLFESKIFVGRSDSARQRLLLPDSVDTGMLYSTLRKKVAELLTLKLPEIEKKNKTIKGRFEDQYPHLIGLFQEDTVGIIDREEALEEAQRKFFRKQKEILESDGLSDDIFRKSLDLSARTLTEYILYRDFTIRKLARLKKEDLEASHHNVIVPRYERYDGSRLVDGVYANNAWLLDDRFMSFQTILSEERMDNIIKEITKSDTDSNDDKPDICMIFSGDPDVEKSVDVVVVEVKRKDEIDKNNFYVLGQLAERAGMLAKKCPNINRMWYYGILTITPHFASILETSKFSRLYSKGQVWYTELAPQRPDGSKISAPATLLDYEALIADAAARNHTFLEILKNSFKMALPTKLAAVPVEVEPEDADEDTTG